jgi:hypothetical protein
LTGDAGKEKTGLDGRFFCVWSLYFNAKIHVFACNALRRSKLAREDIKGTAFFQKVRVIVNVLRGQASLLQGVSAGCDDE